MAPGAGAAIGTLTTTGDATFAAGSALQVDLDATGAGDLVAVGGTATIEGGTTLDVAAPPGDYSDPDLNWTAVTAADGVTEAFDEVSDDQIDVDFVDVSDGRSVTLPAVVAAGPTPVEPEPTPVDPVDPDPEGRVLPTGPTVLGGTSDKSNGPAGSSGAGYMGGAFASTMADIPLQASDGAAPATRTGIAPGLSGVLSSKNLHGAVPGQADTSAFFGIFNQQIDLDATSATAGFSSNATGVLGGVSLSTRWAQGCHIG